jgi:3-phytase (myo-inositol-hexaphosphate 3-phosphohydrolase)
MDISGHVLALAPSVRRMQDISGPVDNGMKAWNFPVHSQSPCMAAPKFRFISRIIATMKSHLLLGSLCLILLTACTTPAIRTSAPQVPVPSTTVDAVIAEAWVSAGSTGDELDSLAVWPTEDGRTWLIATAKSSHTLVVYDAETGQRLRSIGGPGKEPLRFNRPNGIAVFGDVLFVAERDNHRVQALQLPDFDSLGMIGEDVLRAPYGLWVRETGPGQLELLVTDSFMADFRTGTLPPMAELDQRVKRFAIDLDAPDGLHAQYRGAFGDTSEEGALRMVESIAGDTAHDRLLIAEEDRRVGSTLRDYTLDGLYRARSLPVFDADAEGVALWACDADMGYWIAVDQLRPTVFRVYDRESLELVKTFSGEVVANTDGQVLYAVGTSRFPAGALYALHDDQAVAAFDLRDLVKVLGLSGRCMQ